VYTIVDVSTGVLSTWRRLSLRPSTQQNDCRRWWLQKWNSTR